MMRIQVYLLSAILAAAGAHAVASDGTDKVPFVIGWAGEAPSPSSISYDFGCAAISYSLVVNRREGDSLTLGQFKIDGDAVPSSIVEAFSGMLAEFDHVKAIEFSCGRLIANEKLGSFDFTGQLEISVIGKSAHEPDDTEDECYERDGIYLDEVEGKLVISRDKVIEMEAPDTGICVFGATRATILRPKVETSNNL